MMQNLNPIRSINLSWKTKKVYVFFLPFFVCVCGCERGIGIFGIFFLKNHFVNLIMGILKSYECDFFSINLPPTKKNILMVSSFSPIFLVFFLFSHHWNFIID